MWFYVKFAVWAGLMLEPVWDSGGNRLETVLVSRVEEGGWEGDEVTRVNGRGVREAGWVGTRSSLDGMSTTKLTLASWNSMCVMMRL